MADAYQSRAQLVTDFGDNSAGAITAQQLRDFVYSSIILDTDGNLDLGAAGAFILPESVALNLNANNLTGGGTFSFDSGNITSDGSGNLTAVGFVGPITGDLTADAGTIGTFTVDSNGSRGTIVSAYAAGTAYTLTNSAAAVVFGTTSPSITLATGGKYRIRAQVVVELVGATFAGNEALTIKLRRTNNTAGDLTNSTLVYTVPITTTLTNTLAVITLPDVFYTTAGDSDVVTIYAGLAATPSAGSVKISAASIIATNNY